MCKTLYVKDLCIENIHYTQKIYKRESIVNWKVVEITLYKDIQKLLVFINFN